MARKQEYGNESITSLKGADRVRKRPGVIFGSDGLEGCEHAVFEILSNSIDEAREGYGTDITTVRYADGSIEVSDHGRGIPVEWNEKEQLYNWELVFCELYAGGKYKKDTGENYESCATGSSTACTSKKAKTGPAQRKASRKSRRTPERPARRSDGSPTLRFSPTSTSLWITTSIRSSVRQSSTATSNSC